MTEIWILFAPFAIETILDWWLIRKGKKDLPLWLRVFMIAAVGIESVSLSSVALDVPGMALAVAPFAFFDNILSWMRGKRGLDYQGQSKWYDRVFLAWLTKKLTPKGVLIARGVLCLVLVILGLI